MISEPFLRQRQRLTIVAQKGESLRMSGVLLASLSTPTQQGSNLGMPVFISITGCFKCFASRSYRVAAKRERFNLGSPTAVCDTPRKPRPREPPARGGNGAQGAGDGVASDAWLLSWEYLQRQGPLVGGKMRTCPFNRRSFLHWLVGVRVKRGQKCFVLKSYLK